MEKKLKEIIDKYSKDLLKRKQKQEQIYQNIGFCVTHKFDEEARVLRIQADAMNMPIFDMENMINELNKVINAWAS
jgi:hypothetical protein